MQRDTKGPAHNPNISSWDIKCTSVAQMLFPTSPWDLNAKIILGAFVNFHTHLTASLSNLASADFQSLSKRSTAKFTAEYVAS